MTEYKSITALLNYQNRGKVTTARAEERLILLFADSYEYQDERNASFFKSLKKAINLFNNDSIFDLSIEIYFNPNQWGGDGRRFIRIDQDYKDRENDTYTLFSYSLSLPESDKKTMSKAAAVKKTIETINGILEAEG